jgi:hypothetical protein
MFVSFSKIMKQITFKILSLLFTLTLSSKSIAMTYFVNASASVNGNGTTWNNAFTDLQSALSIVVFGDEIWVATGQYKPTSNADRTVAFILKDGVNLYGGFDGTETSISQRNSNTNPTTLNGDIGQIGLNTDNSYNVVMGNNLTTNITLDGFRILNGYSSSSNNGGGLKITNNLTGHLLVKNCYFYSNYAVTYGAAIYTAAANITIDDCEFINNTTSNSGNGGAICNGNNNGGYSTIKVYNSKFKNNIARIGAVFYNSVRLQKLYFDRCLFTNNTSAISVINIDDCMDGKIINSAIIGNSVSDFSSNVLYVNSPSSTAQSFKIINTTIANNYNTYANGISDEIIRLEESYYKVYNSIIYGNTTYAGRQINIMPVVSNSIIEGGFVSGSNIINANPEFVNPNSSAINSFDAAAFNYTLSANSPAIDMGVDTLLSIADSLDLLGASRIQSVANDLGCYESNFINITGLYSKSKSSLSFFDFDNHQLVIQAHEEFLGSSFSVCDVTGKVVLQGEILQRNIPMNLPVGLYIFQSENIQPIKFIVAD